MIEPLRNSLASQLESALAMLEDCVRQCPETCWQGHVGKFPFWQVAYHSLFLTDLYLSKDEQSYRPREFHREDYQFFGNRPGPPFEEVVADDPYTKEEIFKYVDLCRAKASDSLARETPDSLQGPCGFWWYKIARVEFYMVIIRHLQHHAAQMSLFLKNGSSVDIDWVGSS